MAGRAWRGKSQANRGTRLGSPHYLVDAQQNGASVNHPIVLAQSGRLSYDFDQWVKSNLAAFRREMTERVEATVSILQAAIIVFLQERPSLREWTGILMVGAGVLVLAIKK